MRQKTKTGFRRLILAITITSVLSLAQAAPRADSNSTAETEIKTLVSKMAELIVKADWDAYAQRLAPDYVGTTYTSHLENKDEVLARLRDPQRKIIVMEVEPDQRIRLYGDTAVSSTEFTISDRETGHLKTRLIRFTDTWVKRDGQWFLVAEHATSIGK